MKDNFSLQAAQYSQFRPQYPQEMIAYLASFVKNKNTALDVATGNGQVARQLSHFFTTVYATDISQSQLDEAVAADNIIYRNERAEETSFVDRQFDLVTVAQAIHWFDFGAFYKELYRILKPDGYFAVLGYGLFSTNPDSDKILQRYYHEIVGPYWDAERKYLDANYETIPFPLEEIPGKKFENQFTWSFEQLIGYLESWSATQHYKNHNSSNPIDSIREELHDSWEKSNQQVRFPLLLRIGRLEAHL